MWSDEQLSDAVRVLWNAAKSGTVDKVFDSYKGENEAYVVADTVAYTEPLYLGALEQLLSEGKLVLINKEADREIFGRVEVLPNYSQPPAQV